MNEVFVRNVMSLHGDAGRKWIERIPEIITSCAQKWRLTVSPPFSLTYNYVAPAIRDDGTQVVLKIGFPKDMGFISEIEALKVFRGDATVRLLVVDTDTSAALLERLLPGEPVKTVTKDDELMTIVAAVVKAIRKTYQNQYTFSTVTVLADAFSRVRAINNGGTGPLPKHIFEEAEVIFRELSTDGQQYVLHGDLHNDNILSSERGWVAIDPKGVIGPAEYETAAFLRNPYYDLPKTADHKKTTTHRIELLSDMLEFDRQTVKKWAFAQAVLSAIWEYEDSKSLSELYMRNAQLLGDIHF